MRHVYQFVALLVLAAWLPASSYCLIERTGFASDTCCPTDCAPKTPEDSRDNNFCCNLGSPTYKPEERSLAADFPFVPACDISNSAVAVTQLSDTELVHRPDVSPPRPAAPWQFVTRAASPPRAPSVRS